MKHGNAWRPLEERFWEKVNKNGPTVRPELGPCWLWTGAVAGGWYGTTRVEGRNELSHRVAWFLETGKWPNPWALHKCDTGLCVRFSHLFEGTHEDNMEDMKSKSRARRGHAVYSSKLTEDQVKKLRERAAQGEKNKVLTKDFKVSDVTVYNVIKRKTWRHV